ncbi:C-C motif chemokine 3-like [Sminthopsis crassicaudata]|uniref:C-C motif chemokine 3-like n=1 Tax=Sminthopsis crassicaudata TaxID=9301 RepID=UPI003D694954
MISLPVLSIFLISISGLFWGSTADIPPSRCCFKYIQRMIPKKLVVGYYYTSQMCHDSAIVFLTKRGHHVCADLQDKWVQEYVTGLSTHKA